MRAASRSATLAAATLLLACVEGDQAPAGRASSPIIGGTPTDGDPAVVMLVSYPADLSTYDTCTATVIGDDVLLTAAHCVDEATHPDYRFGVFLGPDASAYMTAATLVPQLVPVREVHAHPDYDADPPFHADIGVAITEAPLGIAPIPIARAAPDAMLVGSPARIVGYGQIVYDTINARKHAATTVVDGIDDGADTITVGDLMRRSCIGDSGGPALVVQGGVETLVGVNSYTDLAGCLEPAHYRRLDLFTAFLDVYVPPPTGEGGGGGTPTTTTSGSTSTTSGGTGTDGGGGGEPGAGGGSDDDDGGCAIAPRSEGAPSDGKRGASEAWFGVLAAIALAAVRRSGNTHRGARTRR